jgi:hypothetical protein
MTRGLLTVLGLAVLIVSCTKRPSELLTPSNRANEAPSLSQFASATPTPSRPIQAKPIQKNWPNKYVFTTHSFQENADYELSWEYPEVASAKTQKLRRFNSWIKNRVLGHAARFRRLAQAERRAKHKRKPPIEEGLELSFIVFYSNDRVISIRVTQRVMEAGQMHPINYYETLNYDLERSRALRASDVFKHGYLRTLSNYSRHYLKNEYDMGLDDWVARGTEPRAYNFANWNIVPDGILVSFEDYQVNSHSFGQPEFVVPYSTLKRVLNKSAAHRYFRTI